MILQCFEFYRIEPLIFVTIMGSIDERKGIRYSNETIGSLAAKSRGNFSVSPFIEFFVRFKVNHFRCCKV